jgi:hypothetical protein
MSVAFGRALNRDATFVVESQEIKAMPHFNRYTLAMVELQPPWGPWAPIKKRIILEMDPHQLYTKLKEFTGFYFAKKPLDRAIESFRMDFIPADRCIWGRRGGEGSGQICRLSDERPFSTHHDER